jgi:hypothetical protein
MAALHQVDQTPPIVRPHVTVSMILMNHPSGLQKGVREASGLKTT